MTIIWILVVFYILSAMAFFIDENYKRYPYSWISKIPDKLIFLPYPIYILLVASSKLLYLLCPIIYPFRELVLAIRSDKKKKEAKMLEIIEEKEKVVKHAGMLSHSDSDGRLSFVNRSLEK